MLDTWCIDMLTACDENYNDYAPYQELWKTFYERELYYWMSDAGIEKLAEVISATEHEAAIRPARRAYLAVADALRDRGDIRCIMFLNQVWQFEDACDCEGDSDLDD